jgi:hypothetical protein
MCIWNYCTHTVESARQSAESTWPGRGVGFLFPSLLLVRLRALKLLSGADSHWPNVYIYVSLYALGCGLVDLRLSLGSECVVCMRRAAREEKNVDSQVGSSNYPKALSIIKIITHAKILIAAAPCHSLAFWALQFAWNNLSFFLHTSARGPTWAWRNFHHQAASCGKLGAPRTKKKRRNEDFKWLRVFCVSTIYTLNTKIEFRSCITSGEEPVIICSKKVEPNLIEQDLRGGYITNLDRDFRRANFDFLKVVSWRGFIGRQFPTWWMLCSYMSSDEGGHCWPLFGRTPCLAHRAAAALLT